MMIDEQILKEMEDNINKELELNAIGKINLKYFMGMYRLLLDWKMELTMLLKEIENND